MGIRLGLCGVMLFFGATSWAAPPTGDWGLSAGLGYSYGLDMLSYAGAGGLGGSTLASIQPTTRLALERRVSPKLWLLTDASATYVEGGDSEGDVTTEYSWLRAAVGVGLRYVFDPEAVVRVSVFGSLGGSYSSVRASTSGASKSSTEMGMAGGQLETGLVLDWAFAPQVGLRMGSGVFRASYAKETSGDEHRTSIGLALTPSLQVRFGF